MLVPSTPSVSDTAGPAASGEPHSHQEAEVSGSLLNLTRKPALLGPTWIDFFTSSPVDTKICFFFLLCFSSVLTGKLHVLLLCLE